MATVEQVYRAIYEARFVDNASAAAEAVAKSIAEYNANLDKSTDAGARVARTTNQLINLNDQQTVAARNLVRQTQILQQTQAALAADAATGGARQEALGRAIEGATAKIGVSVAKLSALRGETGANAAEIDNLRTKYDPLYAASQKAAAGLAEVGTLQRAGVLSAQGLAAATDQATEGYRRFTAAAEDAARAATAQSQATYNSFVAKATRGLNFDVASRVPGAQASAQREADVNEAFGAGMDRARAAVDPLFAASLRYAQAQDAINDALSKGAVTGERALELQTALTEAYSRANGPMNGFNAGLEATAKQTAAAMAALDALRRQHDPLHAAMQDSAAAQAEINGLFGAGLLSAEAQAAALSKATLAYRTLAAATEDAARATVAATAAQGQAAANSFVAKGARGLNFDVASKSPADNAYAQREADLHAAFAEGYDKERRAIDPLYAASMKYAEALDRIDAARKKGIVSLAEAEVLKAQETRSFADSSAPIDQHVAALQRIQKESGAAATSTRIMGIQVVQAASGIATGQPVMMVLIQQGHQIVDVALAMGTSFKEVAAQAYTLFQRMGGFPALIGVAVVGSIAALVIQSERAASRMSSLRDTLRLTTDNFNGMATSVDQVARKIAATSGLNFSEAFDATKIIASAKYFSGTADELERLGRMAEGTGKILGGSASDGANFLAEAITNPLVAAKELAEKGLRAMDDELLRSIERLQNAGKGGQALQQVLAAIRPAAEGATKDISPLTKALDDLGNALTGGKDGAAGLGTVLSRALAQAVETLAIQINEIKTLWQEVKDLAAKGTGAVTPGFMRGAVQRKGERDSAAAYQEGLPAVAKVDADFRSQLLSASSRERLDPDLMARLYGAEAVRTGPGQYADSPSGPVGPMQVAPSTFRGLQRLYPGDFGGQNVRDLGTNANASARLLSDLITKYGDLKIAILAYHDGEGVVDDVLKGKPGSAFSAEALDEQRKVLRGYSGTGRAPSRADPGSFAGIDYVAPEAGVAASPSSIVRSPVGAGARDDTRANSDELQTLIAGSNAKTLQDNADKMGKLNAQIEYLRKNNREGTAEYAGLVEQASKLAAESNQLISPQEKFLRGQRDQIAAGAGLYAGDQKLIELRQQMAQVERDQGGSFSPAQRAEAESNALRSMSQEFNRTIAVQDLAIASNDNIAAAYGRGYAAVQQVTAAQAAYTKSVADFPPGSAAQVAAQAKLADQAIRTASSLQNLKLAQDTRSNEDQLAYLRKEASLIGVSTEKRESELAVFKARQEAEKAGVPISEAALSANLRSVEALSRQSAVNKQLESSYTDLANIGVNAFQQVGDAIVEAFAQGSKKSIDFGDVMRGVIASVVKQLATLAVINPLLNAVFGGSRSTLDSGLAVLLGAGGAGALAVSGQATTSASVLAGGASGAAGAGVGAVAATGGGAAAGAGGLGALSGAKVAYDLGKLVLGTGGGQAIGTAIAGALGQGTAELSSTLTTLAVANAGTAEITTASLAAVSNTQIAISSVAQAAGVSAQSAATAAVQISQALPYIGVAVGVVSQLIQGNFRGAALVATGAALGAAIGSVIPVIGTATGAAVGAVVGGAVDLFFPQHKKNAYEAIDVDVRGGRLARGKVLSQLIDPAKDTASVEAFAAGVNEYMDKVGIKLANADSRIGIVGTGADPKFNNYTANPLDLIKALRFTAAQDDGSNFSIIKKGALPGQQFDTLDALGAALLKLANFSDGVDALGLQLRSVGNDLANIEVSGLKADRLAAAASGAAPLSNLETAFQNVLPRETFANLDAFQAKVTEINNFVNGTYPSLLNPVIETTTSLQKSISDLIHTYADAIATAQSYGLATDGLVAAQAKGIQLLQAPAIQALSLSNLQILMRGQTARGENTQKSQIEAFDIQADQQRTQLADAFKNIWGSLIPPAKEYGAALKVLDETLAAERLGLVKQTNQAILDAEKQAADALIQAARGAQDAGLAVFGQFISIRGRQKAASGDERGAEIDAYNLKAIDETKNYDRQLADYYGAAFRQTTDYANRMKELETVQGAERLAIAKKYGDQLTQAGAQAYAQARSSVLQVIGSLADYSRTLASSAASPLAPQAQYSLARRDFRAVSGAAAAGDFNSLQKLQGYSDALLTASRAVNGSGVAYAEDYKAVLAALQGAATAPVDKLTDSAMKQATEEQTRALSGKIDELKAELVSVRRELQQQTRSTKQAA